MKPELEWHMHVGRWMINVRHNHITNRDEYLVQSRTGWTFDFRSLEDAIAYAEKETDLK